jgi:hypothetical protein
LSTAQIARGFSQSLAELERRGARVWAFGHSHHARIWRRTPRTAVPELVRGDCVRLESGARYCLNVGTTGLPFPGKGGPSVALVDFVRGQIRQLLLERV